MDENSLVPLHLADLSLVTWLSISSDTMSRVDAVVTVQK